MTSHATSDDVTYFQVAGIKWWEAKIAATLFGSVPQSSYEEALQYFLRADELNSEWVENTLFIAKVSPGNGPSGGMKLIVADSLVQSLFRSEFSSVFLFTIL
jgi:hypothetical protein